MNEHWATCWWGTVGLAIVALAIWALHLADMRKDYLHSQQAQIDSILAASKEDHQHALRLECLRLNRVCQNEICLPGPPQPAK